MPDASTLELRFNFVDDAQTMDAIVRNENEKELLAILKAVISIFSFSITIDSEGIQPVGFKQYWALAGEKTQQLNAVLTVASFFISGKPKKEPRAATDDTVAAENGTEAQRKKTTLDKAKKELRDGEKLNAETIKELIMVFEANPRLVWHRSNFYRKLNGYSRVVRISIGLLDAGGGVVGSEKTVARKSFASFIVNSNELPPNVDDEAVVEIVAPVLTAAKSKWKGIYKGKSIAFDIKDEEFRKSVFSQRIEFKNGVAIKCVLQLVQSIDGRGIIKTKSITALAVSGIINPGGLVVDTPDATKAAPLIPAKITPPAATIVQETAPAPIQKKLPKIDDRQLDMFA